MNGRGAGKALPSTVTGRASIPSSRAHPPRRAAGWSGRPRSSAEPNGADRFEVAALEPGVRLEVRAFGPLVPGVDEDHPGRASGIGSAGEPAAERHRVATVEDIGL